MIKFKNIIKDFCFFILGFLFFWENVYNRENIDVFSKFFGKFGIFYRNLFCFWDLRMDE